MSDLAHPPRRLFDLRQFGSYVLAGGVSLACEYCLFLVFYYAAGLPVATANVVAFAVGLLVNFALNRQLTFRGADRARSRRQFVLYLLAAGFNVAVTTALLTETKHLGVEPAVTKPLLVAMFGAWNYVVLRRIVFTP